MSGIDSMITQAFDGLFQNGILAILKAIVPAMTVSTGLFSNGTYSAWEAVLFISESLVSIAVALIAYSLFTGVPIHGRSGTSRQLSRLLVAVVLMPFSLYFAQLTLDVNDALTSFVLPYNQLSGYSNMVASSLGGYSVGAIALIGIASLLLYMVLILRTLLVFFTAALLPLALLCESISATRPFSRRILGLFAEMAFLPFFMAVGLRIGIVTSYSTFSSLQVPPLIIAGTFLLPLFVPFIISPAGSRIMQYFGMPTIATVLTTASFASAGLASYTAGFLVSPFRTSQRPAGHTNARGGNLHGAMRPSMHKTVRSFNTGTSHGRAVAEKFLGTTARAGRHGSGRIAPASATVFPKHPALLRSAPKSRHHKIYVGVNEDAN